MLGGMEGKVMKSCRHLGHIKPLEPWVWWECFRALKRWTGGTVGSLLPPFYILGLHTGKALN